MKNIMPAISGIPNNLYNKLYKNSVSLTKKTIKLEDFEILEKIGEGA